ncbi:MAG: alpha/beta fold hydrolase, partial [Acidimicrobiales bacterium]
MTTYHSVEVNGIDVFYREAGAASAPSVLLLHGFPSSSRMWEPLLTRLGDAFHLDDQFQGVISGRMRAASGPGASPTG